MAQKFKSINKTKNVKVFCGHLPVIEKEMNKWLILNNKLNIIDINITGGNYDKISALITYEN